MRAGALAVWQNWRMAASMLFWWSAGIPLTSCTFRKLVPPFVERYVFIHVDLLGALAGYVLVIFRLIRSIPVDQVPTLLVEGADLSGDLVSLGLKINRRKCELTHIHLGIGVVFL
jgi:hypothetical protein